MTVSCCFVVGARALGYSRPDKVRVWQACDSITAPRVALLSALESVGSQTMVICCQMLQCSTLLQWRGALLHFDGDGYISSVLALPPPQQRPHDEDERKQVDDLSRDLLRVSNLRLMKDKADSKPELNCLLYAARDTPLTLMLVELCEVTFAVPTSLVSTLSHVRVIRLCGLRLHNVTIQQSRSCELLLLDDVQSAWTTLTTSTPSSTSATWPAWRCSTCRSATTAGASSPAALSCTSPTLSSPCHLTHTTAGTTSRSGSTGGGCQSTPCSSSNCAPTTPHRLSPSRPTAASSPATPRCRPSNPHRGL